MKTADVCRKHGISQNSFYKWKAKFGGLDVSGTRRLKTPEGKNARLKKLLADAILDNAVLKDLLGHTPREKTAPLYYIRTPNPASLRPIARRCCGSALMVLQA